MEIIVEFPNNQLLMQLLGVESIHLQQIENTLGVKISSRGNVLTIVGSPIKAEKAESILINLYNQLEKGVNIDTADMKALINSGGIMPKFDNQELRIVTKEKTIFPRTLMQANYIAALQNHDMIFGVGPAGTGKTYLAVAVGVSMLISGKVDRIVLTRPAVEAGERLGFLPGDMKEKVDPYLRPIYDALYEMLPARDINSRLASGEIEIAPLAFMRGRTLSNSFIILDEAQNTTAMQMKMFLTRMGENSRMVVNGDITQIDLPKDQKSGLIDALDKLKGIDDISFVYLTAEDIVRHHLVSQIVRAYSHE
jgi:phosphate starvation-inducible PhoH-like protein